MSLFEIDFAKPKTPKITPTVLFVSLILGLFFTLFFYFLPEILLNPLFMLKVLIFAFLIVFILIGINKYWFKFVVKGPPFALCTPEKVKIMVELLNIKSGEKAAELGSGDGRIAIALAKEGAVVTGVEISLVLCLIAKLNVTKENLQDKIQIVRGNIWDKNFSDFDVITLFGIPYIMDEMEKKLLSELKNGARVVVNNFTFPNWEPVKQKENIFLYIKE
ncbi:hypothetical protein A2W32_05010 [candidate division WWE3 bacterium RBG_16_37_10]|uniref:Methyltransferase domain-containing protein n=1 Tax=candidate division WWE3 bacterium RBG_16_37_10 TaxID=1802610 RepID=A0A1F4UXJ6_UNCKA|nr:MAG: hypothetical protein A2W32_05010 [candidate division WWE3 bacterium RBG_16_37_10]